MHEIPPIRGPLARRACFRALIPIFLPQFAKFGTEIHAPLDPELRFWL